MKGKAKSRVGRVTGTKMQKTVVVAVERRERHPLYNKITRHTVKYKVHDEDSACKLGDKVRIVETRPLSREKRWRVVEILTKGEVAEVQPKEISGQ